MYTVLYKHFNCYFNLFFNVCDQQEALSRIISTLANKCEELQHFLESVNKTLTGLQVSS